MVGRGTGGGRLAVSCQPMCTGRARLSLSAPAAARRATPQLWLSTSSLWEADQCRRCHLAPAHLHASFRASEAPPCRATHSLYLQGGTQAAVQLAYHGTSMGAQHTRRCTRGPSMPVHTACGAATRCWWKQSWPHATMDTSQTADIGMIGGGGDNACAPSRLSSSLLTQSPDPAHGRPIATGCQ